MRVTLQLLPPPHNTACSALRHDAADEDAFAPIRAANARAFRLRHTALPNLEEELLRTALRRRATLIAHTVYECTACDVRYLGERRCSECNHFCRVVGLGGACQDCEQPILLSDLLDLEV